MTPPAVENGVGGRRSMGLAIFTALSAARTGSSMNTFPFVETTRLSRNPARRTNVKKRDFIDIENGDTKGNVFS